MQAVTVKHELMVTVLLLVAVASAVAQAAHEPNSDATDLSVSDGEILLYLTPAAKATRKGGLDIFLEQATSDHFNQQDYYVFQMSSTRSCEACSANIGYFAVNKHTADVRAMDVNDEERNPIVTNRELAGVQRIMRTAHHITPEVLKQSRERPIWATMRHQGHESNR